MIRIACVPSDHPYVRAVLPAVSQPSFPHLPPTPEELPAHVGPAGPARPRMVRLPDPLPTDGDGGRWWPPSVLDTEWLSSHRSYVDLVHVHFGFEASTLEQLQRWTELLRLLRLPLVVTVHDLVNPHLREDQQPAYRQRLAVLVECADVVLTLSRYAADRLRRDFLREATVLPHPQVVPDARLASSGRRVANGDPRRIGIFLGAARASVDPTPWVAALATAVERDGGELTVVARDDLQHGSEAAARVRQVDEQLRSVRHRGVELLARPSDEELFQWVEQQDAVALPHRRGTHSGWLEMCWDVGTSVLVPDVGALPYQHTDVGFSALFDPNLPGGAAQAWAALRSDRADPGAWVDPAYRCRERRRVSGLLAAAHAEVYAALVPDPSSMERPA